MNNHREILQALLDGKILSYGQGSAKNLIKMDSNGDLIETSDGGVIWERSTYNFYHRCDYHIYEPRRKFFNNPRELFDALLQGKDVHYYKQGKAEECRYRIYEGRIQVQFKGMDWIESRAIFDDYKDHCIME